MISIISMISMISTLWTACNCWFGWIECSNSASRLTAGGLPLRTWKGKQHVQAPLQAMIMILKNIICECADMIWIGLKFRLFDNHVYSFEMNVLQFLNACHSWHGECLRTEAPYVAHLRRGPPPQLQILYFAREFLNEAHSVFHQLVDNNGLLWTAWHASHDHLPINCLRCLPLYYESVNQWVKTGANCKMAKT